MIWEINKPPCYSQGKLFKKNDKMLEKITRQLDARAFLLNNMIAKSILQIFSNTGI